MLVVASLVVSATASAQEYVTIDISKPAAEVWEKVGDYFGISEWLGLDCEIIFGDGVMGSVRSLLGGLQKSNPLFSWQAQLESVICAVALGSV